MRAKPMIRRCAAVNDMSPSQCVRFYAGWFGKVSKRRIRRQQAATGCRIGSLARWEVEMEWMPIERAPRDGTALLLFCPGVRSWNRHDGMPDIVVGMWVTSWGHNGAWESDVGDVDEGYESTGAYFVHEELSPTHWMPLPAPPIDPLTQP